MKKIFLILACIITLPLVDVYASYLPAEMSCSEYDRYVENGWFENGWFDNISEFDSVPYDSKCAVKLTETCYESLKLYSCEQCKPGYTKVQKGWVLWMYDDIYFNVCCMNTCTIGAIRTCTIGGYAGTQSVIGGNSCTGSCTYSACKPAVSCAFGEYETSDGWCGSCYWDTGEPSFFNEYGEISIGSDDNADSIDDCYIPAGAKSEDDSGYFELLDNCYYSN